MENDRIEIFADDKGIWRKDGDGPKFGIEWEEIYKISGYTMKYYKKPEIELELDYKYGEYFRINETWEGFSQVVEAINNRKLFQENDWLEKVGEVGEEDEIYTIWAKS